MYDRYKTEKAYPEFVETYLKLLSAVEDYYSFAEASIVLDIIPDKMAKLLRVEIACEKEEQAKCPNPLSVPAGLSDPTRLQFEHPVLTEEERFEKKAINSVLPMPHHPDLEKLPPKDPMHCLAAAVHYVLRCRLFKNNPSQGTTADSFQVGRKKFYQAITGKTYNAGTKPTKAMKMQ